MSLFHAGKEHDSDTAEQPRSMEEVELKLLRQNRRYHLGLIAAMAFLGLGLLVLALVDMGNSTVIKDTLTQTKSNSENNAEALDILRRQTSPERLKQNEQRLSQIILQVDCNNRDAIEDVIEGLKVEGLLTGDITVITPECQSLSDD